MNTQDKPDRLVDAAKAEQRQTSKRRYEKPTVSDFVQPAVAFGSPSDYYTCPK